jgi:hypothetical protein
MLWAEPAKVDALLSTSEWAAAALVSIWSANYLPSTGWSAPQKVFEGREFIWPSWPIWKEGRVVGSANRSAAASTTIVFPVAEFSSTLPRKILLLRLAGDRWVQDSVSSTMIGAPVSPSFASNGAMEFLTFLGPDPQAQSDENSVLFQRSSDGGQSWSALRVIDRSGANPAYDAQLAMGSDGVLHLTWLKKGTNGLLAVLHSASRDGGATWSPIERSARSSLVQELRTIVDACGILHAIFQDVSESGIRSHVVHQIWDGRWRTPTKPFDERYTRSASIALSVEGNPLLVFLRSNSKLGADGKWHPYFSELMRR